MRVQNIGANNQQQKTNFGSICVIPKTNSLGYTEFLKKHSLIEFVMKNPSILDYENSKNPLQMILKKYAPKDIFLNPKELEELNKAFSDIEKASINATEEVLENAKKSLQELFWKFFNNAKDLTSKRPVKNEKIEKLIKADK